MAITQIPAPGDPVKRLEEIALALVTAAGATCVGNTPRAAVYRSEWWEINLDRLTDTVWLYRHARLTEITLATWTIDPSDPTQIKQEARTDKFRAGDLRLLEELHELLDS